MFACFEGGYFYGDGMKFIMLTQDKFAIVDDENFNWLNRYNWCAKKHRNTFYAVRGKYGKTIRMHREILGLKEGDGKQTDHKNHNGLDNRETNIRVCTNRQNAQNSLMRKTNKSGYKGLRWDKTVRKWQARIGHKGTKISLGYFKNKIDAAKAYNAKAIELFGEYASTNKI